ncbi:hypothetical protein [Wolbachia endosymbiont (group B) of Gerris lacustris]|uniref:hypothetical protein n=1 Tax=Wolbachia endosymbiont (group B) of Gerris lacustris TaxID=3066159 RepID=UPI0033411A4C
MPSKPRYFTYSSMAFFPLLSIRCLYSGNWYKYEKLYQCPESSLSNLTISKSMHQMSF